MPFPLGRPLGAPHEPEFQRRVLSATLALLERLSGPILEDFPDDGPAGSVDEDTWACPLPLPSAAEPATERDALSQQLAAEIGRLRPWYEEAVKKYHRTAVGVSGLGADRMPELAGLLVATAFDEPTEDPAGAATTMPVLLRHAADDLKAYYMEAAAAQPSATAPSPHDMNVWLLGETRLGETLYRARETLLSKEEPGLKGMARVMVPAAYATRPTRD